MDPPPPFTRRRVLAGAIGVLGTTMIPPSFIPERDHHPEIPPASDIMRWADQSRGTPFSKDPSVVRFGDRYLMYFSIPPERGDDRWGQAIATSEDLLNWEPLLYLSRMAMLRPGVSARVARLCWVTGFTSFTRLR
jgi:hypothetical protein